jgi:photosystem II stability/assembly factor-like uncharacterized protein
MPDLDTELSALRDHLRESITPPDLALVADRARERTVRRRTQIAAIAAVLVVTAAVPVLRAMPGADAPAADQPSRAVPPTYTVDFADTDHGFAIDRQCDRQGDTCRLLWTSDGGKRWSAHDLPSSPDSAIVGMIVLGPDRVAIDRTADGVYGAERIYSDDAGETWQKVPSAWADPRPEILPPVEAIPAGGVLGIGCAGAPGPESCGQLVVTMPDSGQIRALTSQPELYDMTPGPVPTAGGTWWVVGEEPTTRSTVLAVSTDDGRTWRSTPMDVPDRRMSNTWSVVEGGGVLYATVSGTVDRTLDLLGVFRSDDGGQTWRRTYRPTGETTFPGFVGTPLLTPDGLVMKSGRATYESDADAATFTLPDDELTGSFRWTRAGYLNDLPSSGDEFAISTDGVEWRPFTVG